MYKIYLCNTYAASHLPKHFVGRKAILKYPTRQKHFTKLNSAVHMCSHPPLSTAQGPSVGSITVKI